MNSPQEFFDWFRMEHGKLHTEWSADVGTPGYNKQMWIHRERAFHTYARTIAESLGVEPPYLRW